MVLGLLLMSKLKFGLKQNIKNCHFKSHRCTVMYLFLNEKPLMDKLCTSLLFLFHISQC